MAELARFWGLYPDTAGMVAQRLGFRGWQDRLAAQLVLEAERTGKSLDLVLEHAVREAFEERTITRSTFGAGRHAAARAWHARAITTAEHAAGKREGRARAVFVAGFEAWERAAEPNPGDPVALEHWLRRALGECVALLGGQVRGDDLVLAVLDAEGRVWAETWAEAGSWTWQIPIGVPTDPPEGFTTGTGLAAMVEHLRIACERAEHLLA
jgi:hypothetical protein